MSKVVYPGTFDPITLGHEAIIRRASGIFTSVVVGVARGVHKRPLFSLADRLEMVNQAIGCYDNVTAESFDGLLATFLEKQRARIVVRGMRMVSDFELELQMASINRGLGRNIETLFMAPDPEHTFIYSRIVREVAMLGGEVGHYVNSDVASRLTSKLVEKRRNDDS